MNPFMDGFQDELEKHSGLITKAITAPIKGGLKWIAGGQGIGGKLGRVLAALGIYGVGKAGVEAAKETGRADQTILAKPGQPSAAWSAPYGKALTRGVAGIEEADPKMWYGDPKSRWFARYRENQ